MSESDEAFKKELASLLNRYSWDNTSDTPDYILADYIERCLMNYCSTIRKTITWHTSWERIGEENNEKRVDGMGDKK